ncbi:hypothetical protein JTE90_003557 [Oedothorax gibbosus]|uniref:Uncharacterized protein n=1 Tax=Oedothorax gibbosus TaxID=931172 RepID=A0AAV6VJ68_9ARAC|nr:hypothetical protein JTE90_003557 [Oedothorax gibbosus]
MVDLGSVVYKMTVSSCPLFLDWIGVAAKGVGHYVSIVGSIYSELLRRIKWNKESLQFDCRIQFSVSTPRRNKISCQKGEEISENNELHKKNSINQTPRNKQDGGQAP